MSASGRIPICSGVPVAAVEELLRGEVQWNPQDHTEENVASIAASIVEFGFVIPVLIRVSDGAVAGGHGRLFAARKLLAEGNLFDDGGDGVCVPYVRGEWSDGDLRRLNLSLNHVQAQPNPERLRALLGALREQFSPERLMVTGLRASELATLLREDTRGEELRRRLLAAATVAQEGTHFRPNFPVSLHILDTTYALYARQRATMAAAVSPEAGLPDNFWMLLVVELLAAALETPGWLAAKAAEYFSPKE